MTGFTACTYRCPDCMWITEADEWPDRCGRCQSGHELVPLTPDTLAALLDQGEVIYCETCQRVHSGPIQMEKTTE